ncbi:MAG TPA: amino acid adenylation domain-containing protein, partial [Longimicrobium sp.]|nr:amino acid adenylation domain-containing protein [Longimicrobium sp.]
MRRTRAFSHAKGITFFTTLLAAFQALLGRYSGQADFCVGSGLANRRQVALEEVIGMVVNSVGLRADLRGDPTGAELLRRVRECTLRAYEHQELPFDQVVRRLQPERSASTLPIYQTAFSFHDSPMADLSFAGLRLEMEEAQDNGSAKHDLQVTVMPRAEQGFAERADEVLMVWEYDTDLFAPATLRGMIAHYETLLEALVSDPARRLSALSLLGEDERRRVVEEWNRTDAPLVDGRCIHLLIAEHAARTPDAAAVVDFTRTLTYRELDERASRLTRRLRALGVGPEVRVGVHLERSVDLVVALLAVLRAGGAYLPLDPAYPAERLAFMLRDADASVVLTLPHLRDRLPPTTARVVALGEAGEDAAWDDALPEVHSGSAAYVLYTSGSTGRPKGVVVSHGALLAHVAAAARAYGLAPGDRVLVFAAISFDPSLEQILAPLTAGAAVAFRGAEVWSPDQFADVVERLGLTVINPPTAYWHALAADDAARRRVRARVRLVIVGGEAQQPATVAAWHRDPGAAALVNAYGPTEGVVTATLHPTRPEDGVRGRVPIGRPLAGRVARVLDAGMGLVPDGVPGELYLGGSVLARGYLGHPALTAERFVPDPYAAETGGRLYRTGDRVRRLSDGTLEYLGRLDEQVKIRGFRVEPGEVEAALRRQPGVEQCVVAVREDAGGGRMLVAYLVGDADPCWLEAELRRTLPHHAVPAAFVALDALPLSLNGKVDTKALPAPVRAGAPDHHQAPRTPVEEVLAAIWAELLRLDRVGTDENFFDLGGHSLLATRAVSRIREVLSVDLPLRALFEAPTVAELAARVEEVHRAGRLPLSPVVPVERTAALPLSFAQERLWFLDRLDPGSALYNLPAALRLRGLLDVGALERTLGQLVRRHEALRTTFREVDGAPVQVIAPPAALSLPVAELSRGEAAEARIEEEAARPFDLAAGPLFRVRLLRVSEDDHVLLLCMHHAVSDGWSMGVLFRELAVLYDTHANGEERRLPPLPVQYADYAVWQREQLRGPLLEAELAWWRERLAGAPALLELPIDRPRPAVQSYRGAEETLELPGDLVERLRALGRGEGATLYMVMLAAFQVLLSKYAATEDVVVGSPVAGRTRGEVEGLIGFFANTLVLRTDLSGNPGFREAVRRVRGVTLGAWEHQEVPFEAVVEALNPDRSLSHAPLVQVMFALATGGDAVNALPSLPRLDTRAVEVRTGRVKFDLSLSFSGDAGGLSGRLSYATDLFDRATIQRMCGHLARVLAQVADDLAIPLSQVALMDDAERRQVLEEWNRTQVPYPADRGIHQLFEVQAEATSHAVAVVGENEALTYGELNERANRLAHHLRARGVGPEVLVAVCVRRGAPMLEAMLAALKAGGGYLPLDPDYPAERIAYMLRDSGARVLVTESVLLDGLSLEAAESVVLDRDTDVIATQPGTPPAIPCSPSPLSSTLAYVIYTSGSTGLPKGVRVEHGALAATMAAAGRAFGFGSADRAPSLASFAFDIWLFESFLPLLAGGSVRLFPRERVLEVPRLVEDLAACTVLHAVPALMHSIVQAVRARPGGVLPGMRRAFVGGDAVAPDLLEEMRQAFPAAEIHVLYGPTEGAIICSTHRLGDQPASRQMVGRPLGNATLYVLLPGGSVAPAGAPGELYLGGHSVARDYLGRPALTAERFVPDPFSARPGARLYRTGDRVRRQRSGELEFLGRTDRQVKLRGFRIEPGEIEAALRRHSGVDQCVVVAREDVPGETRLVAYLVGGAHADSLRAHLRGSLPDYMVPSAFVA